MNQVTPVLKFSQDPLSVTTPTYIDITQDFISAEWADGKAKDLDEPQAGRARFVIRNTNRRFEPEFKGVLANQVTNPSFEVDLAGWTSAGGTNTRDVSHATHGIASLHIVSAASGQGMDYKQLSVVNGQRYYVEVDVSVVAGTATLRISDGVGTQKALVQTSTTGTLSLEFVADATAADWRIRLLTSGAVSHDLYYDSVFITELPTPTGLLKDAYLDGTQPNCRWAGTAHASASYYGGPFWPNIAPLRRFKLQVVADGVTYDEGIWYAQSYEVVYPDKAADYSQVIVDCVDGFGLLSLDTLDFMDPPDASSYGDVVAFDQPWGYWRLGEPAGTRAVAVTRRKRVSLGGFKGHWTIRARAGERAVTRSEVEGVAGPAGLYKNNPSLGQPGLIIGDRDTSVSFDGVNQHATVALESGDLTARNSITVEAWVNFAGGNAMHAVDGPFNTGLTLHAFVLSRSGGNVAQFAVNFSDGTGVQLGGTTTISNGATHHLVGTYDGQTVRLYVDGVLEDSGNRTGSGTILTGSATELLYIGGNPARVNPTNGRLDEIAVYENALSPDRILAHYNAGANRGFAQQAAGTRISTIATSDLWSEAGIQTGSFQVAPRFEFGQPKLEEIMETVRAEMPDNHFYFNGTGDPVYLPWNYKDGLGAEVTLGENAPSEIPYTEFQPVYDDEIYNEVTTSTEAGTAQVSSDAASQAANRRRAAAETGLILVDDANAKAISAAVLDKFKDPMWRVPGVSLTGATPQSRMAILDRDIGDMIRIKRRQGGSTVPIDILTTVLGQSKAIDTSGNLWCTWTTARGFNASLAEWRLGISGFSELDSTTVLA